MWQANRASRIHRVGTSIIGLLCILWTTSDAIAEELSSERKAAFVFPMTSGNATSAELTFFDELLTQALAEHSPHPILSTSDIEALVKHREQEQLLGCVDDACGQELAELTGSRYLIRGRVHTVGESFHILLTLLDTKGENQPARSRATGLKKAKEQVRAITRAARRLFGVEEQRISLEELVHTPVLSGSRTYESSLMTPAWNITLTGKELRDRGYTELSEIFDDLPGIDVVRPRGASWLRTYWRGRRDTWQDHFLFLIDDIPWHDHLYGNARMQIPLSNIERVEVFYGPGSLMHGANALMGVVQVITKRELKVLGTSVSGHVGTSAPGTGLDKLKRHRQIADVSFQHVDEDYSLSVTTRFDQGRLDNTNGNAYEWTRYEYYDDPDIWGEAFLNDYEQISGGSASPFRHFGTDIRLDLERLELGFQYYQSERGTGYQFAADRFQNKSIWSDIFYNAFIRTDYALGNWNTNLLVRHRGSRWPNGNTLLLRSGGTTKLNRYVSNNTSTDLQATVGYQLTPGLFVETDKASILAGAKFGLDDLGRDWAKASSDLNTGEAPEIDQELSDASPRNRVNYKHLSGFALLKYALTPDQRFDIGVRRELTRGEVSDAFRLSYVGHAHDHWTWKLLFGSAFAMPVPRQTTFVASTNSNQTLTSEQTTSIEAGLYYNSDDTSFQMSPYLIWNDNVIDVVEKKFENANRQEIIGLDIGVMRTWSLANMRSLRLWIYATWLPMARQDTDGVDCSAISTNDHIFGRVADDYEFGRQCQVGDVARLKFWGGAELDVHEDLSITLLGRHYSSRPTVASNPIESIDAYATLDLSLSYRDVGLEGLHLGFRVTNLLDTVYFHPGVNGADAGNTPGQWEENDEGINNWVGSAGSYNSLIPQPSRTFHITLGTEFD